MIWLSKDFDLLSVLLRALLLALEAVTVGGVLFLLLAARPVLLPAQSMLLARTRGAVRSAALFLLLAQAASLGLTVLLLTAGSGLPLRSLLSSDFLWSGSLGMAGSLLLLLLLGRRSPGALYAAMLPALLVTGAAVAQSHAASRMEERGLLVAFTAMHHLGTAGWVGAMCFLLLTLRRMDESPAAQALARRYSAMAMVSVAVLLLGGLGMSWFYVGSWNGLYGTSYGLMLQAKTYLLLLMLLLGSGNYRLLRSPAARAISGIGTGTRTGTEQGGVLRRLRSFSEAEIGLGLTAILAAASLTSMPPAVDMQGQALHGREIAQRLRPVVPRLRSPAFAQLTPPTTGMRASLEAAQYGGGSESDAADRAWSEYNHHWAGIDVLLAGLIALLAGALRPGAWQRAARNWPLLFVGLAVFILLRADPENWPLGPRGFWQSFASPDVLQHRFYALLICCFAGFEWAVATGRWRRPAAAYVFPLLCAAGGAALLTHSHGMSDVQEETLAELAHTPIAVLGATAGWCRWLQLRLHGSRGARIAGVVWPVALVLVGLLLLNYREA